MTAKMTVSDEPTELQTLPSTDLEAADPAAAAGAHSSTGRNRKLQVCWMAFQSLGAIYGDIGTSPLYVYSSIFPHSEPTERQSMGAASCIFWTFTIVVMVKYCLIVLLLGPNNGEGGQVAIYAKLARTLHVGPRGVVLPGEMEPDMYLELSKSLTRDSQMSRLRLRMTGWFHEVVFPKLLLMLCFIGCSLVISDGLLTPTTSVLTAVGGIEIPVPSISNLVMPISVIILLLLFLSESSGAGRLSIIFAPIVLIWFVAIAVTGIINIAKYPSVMKALSPKFAIDFLRDDGGIDLLGAVMLSVTGVEAMFADVGHFGRESVQLSLSCIVWPCLMLQYFGQAAFIIRDPSATANSFYLSIPGGTNTPQYWIMFVLATLATVIASQALILGVFSILRQMIHIDCFPPFKVIHTSRTTAGQVYIPAVNYILMVGVILTTVGFRTSNNVTAAYGLGVSLDFIVTTTLITFCMIYVFRFPFYITAAFCLAFGAFDMCFVIANIKKIPHGAWFPLAVAILFTCFISFWRWARALKVDNEYSRRIRVGEVFEGIDPVRQERQELIVSSASSTKGAGSVRPLNHIPNRDDNTIGLRDAVYFVPTHRLAEDLPVFEEDDAADSLQQSKPLRLIPRGSKPGNTNPPIDLGMMPNTAAIVHTNATHTLHSPHTIPAIMVQLLNLCPALPEHVIFLGVRIVDAPFVDAEAGRIALRPYRKIPRFHRCIVRFGFMDHVAIDDALIAQIIAKLPSSSSSADASSPAKSAVTTVYHVIENEDVCAKRPSSSTSSFPIALLRRAWMATRAGAIEWVFSPIDRVLGHRNYVRIDDDDDESGREKVPKMNLMYLGSKIYI
ncbi:high affinity potassium transporter [Myxozyma melibiosi]|uniref:High affinity potassium transporter n=1 Tax=Myxozyma melibiosi TaxID=54550 RepID=A0ABR1FFB6_9ASCO